MAIRFDNAADSLTRTATLPSTGTFSFCLHCYQVVDRNAYSTLFSFDNASQYFTLASSSDGQTITLYTPSSVTVLAVTTNAWYFFGATKSGTAAVGYGAALTSRTLTSASVTAGTLSSANTLYVAQDGFNEPWNGRIQNVKIWDGVALTAAEMEAERYSLRPRRTAGLWAWLPMLTSGLAGTDWSGNGRDFTANGTLTTEDGPPLAWQRRARLFVPAAVAPAAAVGHYYRQLIRAASQ